ncbi:MAG: Gfo/Idh/MocA family oxidoreductase [Ignavibacteria bacterium]|nr:Gfo/Idh/MocA family oxidoreductase [Ignavibacteria bacterium]
MMSELNIAVIGCGKWGMNHVRTAYGIFGERLKFCCDNDPMSGDKVKEIAPESMFSTDIEDVIKDTSINAAIVSTPAETHFEITKSLLEAGKHVLVEKPITLRSSEAKTLNTLALEKRTHTYGWSFVAVSSGHT